MCDIQEWLRLHPAISIRMMEITLGLPIGTVRVTSNRSIPLKYVEEIKSFLRIYGYITSSVSERKEYFFRNGVFGYMEGKLFRRVISKDADKFYLID